METRSPEPKNYLNILVVDDDPLSRQSIKFILELEFKQTVRAANGGVEALEALKEVPADVVVTDFCMPGMNGHELMRQIKKQFVRTHVIVISSDFEAAGITPEQLITAGATDALSKDEIMGGLPAAIRKCLAETS